MPQPRFMQEQNLKEMLRTYAWQQDHERLCGQITPKINEIERLLNKKNDLYFETEPDTNAIELKLKAMTHAPTTIEKTMTTAQLFAADNPLWTLDFAGEDIDKLLKLLKERPRTEEEFNIALRSVQNPMLIMDEFGNFRLNKLHPRNKEVATALVKQKHLL